MEIGSEYSLQLSDFTIKEDNLYQYLSEYNTLFLDSGRSCLKYLSYALSEGTILLPEYICESVVSSFANRNIIFYKINENFSIDIEDLISKITPDVRIILIVHYFGAMQPKEKLSIIAEIKEKDQITIIEDTTQSIFSRAETIGDYCICSLRKWFAIPDGGVLYSKKILPKLPDMTPQKNNHIEKINPFILKQLYLDNIISSKSEYRRQFADCENMIDNRKDILLISDVSSYLLQCVNLSNLIEKRKENYSYLKKLLAKKNIIPIINIQSIDCPFVFPIYTSNRDTFRDRLIESNIYCAVHWPIPDNFSENQMAKVISTAHAKEISAKIISFPIDQRYSKAEMNYLSATIIKEYYRDGM